MGTGGLVVDNGQSYDLGNLFNQMLYLPRR